MKKQIRLLSVIAIATGLCLALSLSINAQSTATGNAFVPGRFLGWGSTTSGDLSFKVNGNTKMVLQNTTGNFGIGTTTPRSALDVKSNSNQTVAYFNKEGVNAQATAIELQSNGTTGLKFSHANYFYDAWIDHNYSGALTIIFAVRGVEKMRIQNNGNVRIGTFSTKTYNSTDYKLNVDGKIRADEIKVNSTGADFVFQNDYKLMPLEELENFINDNKHLPEIPSASEMQEEGMSVGETQTKLLQKVEELTLYVIELKKEVEMLKRNSK